MYGGAAVEVVTEEVRVEGGRHEDDLQVLELVLHLSQGNEQEVRETVPLVDLILGEGNIIRILFQYFLIIFQNFFYISLNKTCVKNTSWETKIKIFKNESFVR